MLSKEFIRQSVLAARRAVSKERVQSASVAIAARALALPEVLRAGTCLAYMPVRNEADPGLVIAAFRRRGAVVAVPSVQPRGTFVPVLLPEEPAALRTGPFGILEPDPSTSGPVPPDQIELVLIPGVAFDLAGRRLGHGKGYYDRFLSTLPRFATKEAGTGIGPVPDTSRPFLLGVAYEFQLVPEIPSEPHDIPVDAIVTEERVIRPHVIR